MDRSRLSSYQNYLAEKCVSSSKQMSGICAPCQFEHRLVMLEVAERRLPLRRR
jgi:hypothetical protein